MRSRIRFSFVFIAAIFTIIGLCATQAGAAAEKVLHQFNQIPHGISSNGVVADAEGNLYGTTTYGGAYHKGLVFKLAQNSHGGWTETVLYSFTGGNDGANPECTVTLDAAGNIYGAAYFGGVSNQGNIFELTPNGRGGWTETVLHSFAGGSDGQYPFATVALDASGNIYGTTHYGGSSGSGVAFALTPSSGVWTETILHTFTGGNDGGNPGTLVLDKNGNLFGSALFGGLLKNGLVFELSPSSGGIWTENIIYQFSGVPDGALPGTLLFDNAGNLFGATEIGGTSKCNNPNQGCGTVFELKHVGSQWKEAVLYSFSNSPQGLTGNTVSPSIGAFDDAGNLYGETYEGGSVDSCENGCGTIFELSPNQSGGWSETDLHDFTAGDDGYTPYGGVVLGSHGRIYGSTSLGGANQLNGTVFALSPTGNSQWKLATLYNFPYVDGAAPRAGLAADGLGNFYGTTSFGGIYDLGTAFKLTPASGGNWTETVIYSFSNGTVNGENGVAPSALIFDAAGNLYGTTTAGGGFGSVFELSPGAGGTWTENDLYTFRGRDYPVGGLVMDKAGNLYGTTSGSNEGGLGTVFELSFGANGKWNETTLYSFAGYPSDGANPMAGLIIDAAGNLYGTTQKGGSSVNCVSAGQSVGCGTVFELSLSVGRWSASILYSFIGSSLDGANPEASLIFDSAGNLYGTTANGGNEGPCLVNKIPSCGIVFELSASAGSAWSEKILHEFTDANGDGSTPIAGLLFDQSGNLYGSTTAGGAFSQTLCRGGCGTVFELSPASGGEWTESVLHSFGSGYDGQYPASTLVLDSTGNLYGTSVAGGQAGVGTVFKIKP